MESLAHFEMQSAASFHGAPEWPLMWVMKVLWPMSA